jgi:hypothetical protein
MTDLAFHPPRYLTAPHPTEAITTAVAAVALALMVFWAWRDRATTSERLGPFVVIGGSLAALQEPVVDCLGHIWLRTDIPAFTTFGREMPVWGVLAYGTFYGLFSYLLYRIASRGGSRQQLRVAIAAILAYNLAMEPLLIALRLYAYYGPQPMSVFGYPAFWPVVNVTGIVLASLVLVKQRQWFAGRRAALALLVVPVTVAGGSIASGLPVFSLLNGGASPSRFALWIGALATIALGLLIMEGAVQAQSAPARTVTDPPGSVPERTAIGSTA